MVILAAAVHPGRLPRGLRVPANAWYSPDNNRANRGGNDKPNAEFVDDVFR